MKGDIVVLIVRGLTALCCIVVMAGCIVVQRPSVTSLSFTNRIIPSEIVVQLYVSESASRVWGPDQLGSNIILPDETFVLTGVRCGISYDFRAVTKIGRCAYLINEYISCSGESFLISSAGSCSNYVDGSEHKTLPNEAIPESIQ